MQYSDDLSIPATNRIHNFPPHRNCVPTLPKNIVAPDSYAIFLSQIRMDISEDAHNINWRILLWWTSQWVAASNRLYRLFQHLLGNPSVRFLAVYTFVGWKFLIKTQSSLLSVMFTIITNTAVTCETSRCLLPTSTLRAKTGILQWGGKQLIFTQLKNNVILAATLRWFHGRGCNPHRCTTTFANHEITSLWRHW